MPAPQQAPPIPGVATGSVVEPTLRVTDYASRTLEHPSLRPVKQLKSLAIETIVRNFRIYEDINLLPAQDVEAITSALTTAIHTDDATLESTVRSIHSEPYWRRCCLDRWQSCHPMMRVSSWKQTYLENHTRDLLEAYDQHTVGEFTLKKQLSVLVHFVHAVEVRQLLSHLSPVTVTEALPNMSVLKVHYGVQRALRMDYNRMLFGMQMPDATAWAQVLKQTESLTMLDLSGNLVDDDMARFMSLGLKDNMTITHLDLSHNKIGNRGLRQLAKALGPNSVLTNLNLCDNQIHADGGRYLGRALKANQVLIHLNLRLNRLADGGGRMLFYGMHLNPACQLLSLDVSSNAMGLESAKAVAEFLQDDPPLHKLDLSGNFIEEEGAQCIQKSLTDNSNLWHMVLQKNHIPGELERDLEEHVHGKKMDFNAPPDPEAAQFMR
eukprot:TRINITY_DN3454_c0_g1_i15.p1 TRINITY_DN3454_c0_g1~~TRINITY_DN3454_c0_g1_i15.p1  ORF type:complete len:437 (+),score=128.33 TRINITY_DN3454_c0_g1_i15:43-1353(+)